MTRADHGNKQQQQQLSHKVSADCLTVGYQGALQEQRISGVVARFRSIQSLGRTFSTCSGHLKGYLRTCIGYSSSGSASKCQENRLFGWIQMCCESNQSRPFVLRFSRAKACPRSPSDVLCAGTLLSEHKNSTQQQQSASAGRHSCTERDENTRGSEGRSAHHGAACRRPAPPRCCPQSRTALPPRYAAPAAAAAPCAPPYGRSPAPPSPHRAGGGRATSRCGATPARALPCLCARSRRARRVSGT